MNKFHEWIRARGPEKLATKMRVDRSTVYRWLNGTVPQPDHIFRLLKMARGKFKLQDIYASVPQKLEQEQREAMQKISDILMGVTTVTGCNK